MMFEYLTSLKAQNQRTSNLCDSRIFDVFLRFKQKFHKKVKKTLDSRY